MWMRTLSVANITSVCQNKDNVDFVSAPMKRNVLYHYTLDNTLSVDKKRQDHYYSGDWCLLLSHFYGILLEII